MVFVDTSGFVAAFDGNNPAHSEVSQTWRELAERRVKLLTTQLVFAETVTYLRRRGGWKTSRDAGEAILRSQVIDVIRLDEEGLESAWREYIRSGDPKLSFCDAASFIVMREHGVSQALTLDIHFRDAGFHPIPD